MADDPKDTLPDEDKTDFNFPVKEPTPEPDYFPHDAPITEADIPPVEPREK